MIRIIINLLGIAILAFLVSSCIPDRMPTEPEEIERPVFAQIEFGESNLLFSLDHQIKFYFYEAMDLNSFPANVIVESVSGKIDGAFSYGESDTIVVYTPLSSYNPAEYYMVSLKGGVRDTQGNSMVSPNDEDIPITSWFFTSGEYSNNGFPLAFIRDKSNRNMIYKVGELNVFLDSLLLPAPEDYQTSALEVEKNSDKLFIVNLKLTDGLVTVLDPATFSILKELTVGLGPTNIEFSNDKGYVTNSSAKSFSVIDLISLTTETTFTFPDDFRPKDVSYSTVTNKLYFYNTVNSNLKIVNANDYNDAHTVPSGLTTKPTDIEITKNGRYLFILGTNSSVISVFDVESETSSVLDFGYQYLTDGTMGNNFYYVAYYRGTGGNDVGGILKIDNNTNSINAHLEWGYQVDQLKLTEAEELLYAVTPVDSTVQVIETRTMNRITSTKVNGSLKYLALTNNNY